jgi:Spy/CpxP family protein refolding chaperone
MKTKPAITRRPFTATLAALISGSLLALAQPAPNEKPENRPNLPREGQFRERLQSIVQRADFAAFYRVLTEEQRESFRTAMEDQREKMRDLEEKTRDARKELIAAGLAEKFDEEAVRQKALGVAKLEAETTVIRAKALSKVKPPLSAEQIEQIKNPPAFNPGENRFQPAPARRTDRAPGGPRDENDLPAKPKTEK